MYEYVFYVSMYFYVCVYLRVASLDNSMSFFAPWCFDALCPMVVSWTFVVESRVCFCCTHFESYMLMRQRRMCEAVLLLILKLKDYHNHHLIQSGIESDSMNGCTLLSYIDFTIQVA